MKKELASISMLLKNKDNRRWLASQWIQSAFSTATVIVSACTFAAAIWSLLDISVYTLDEFIQNVLHIRLLTVFVVVGILVILWTLISSLKEMKSFSYLKVETERSGCSVEISVTDSYLTNAFDNYPNCAMIIGINKAFWFQEAEHNSLVADMWGRLKESKESVQEKIDKALQELSEKNPDAYIDQNRPKVTVKCGETTVDRDNYKVGTVIGVDLKWPEPEKEEKQNVFKLIPGAFDSKFKRIRYDIITVTDWLLRVKPKHRAARPAGFFKYLREHRYKTIPENQVIKKLYLIANSEVVQGCDATEPIKVTFDRNASVVENFPKIWEYFEQEEEWSTQPPKHINYQPLLIPLIGAGVANEGYSDMEIFSKIVDLYYEHLRCSIRAEKHPAIPNLIINIQSKTAIELTGADDGNSRKIDIKTAFWYLNYRNKVNPVVSKEHCTK